MTTIYILSHPITGEVRYVGKTTLPLYRRLNSHRQARYSKKTHTQNWISGLYDQDLRPSIEELEVVDNEESCEAERYWIWWYKSQGYRLTNHTEGGEGNPGLPRTPEWKAKIGIANRGSNNSMAKLDEEKVKEIHTLFDKKSHGEIAELYGVSRSLISMIGRGDRWKSIKESLNTGE